MSCGVGPEHCWPPTLLRRRFLGRLRSKAGGWTRRPDWHAKSAGRTATRSNASATPSKSRTQTSNQPAWLGRDRCGAGMIQPRPGTVAYRVLASLPARGPSQRRSTMRDSRQRDPFWDALLRRFPEQHRRT